MNATREAKQIRTEGDLNYISGVLVDAAIKVHSKLGPGLLESTYEICLAHELSLRNVKVERQVPVPVLYETVRLDAGYRLDLLVEDSVIVDLKAIEAILPIHKAQLPSYLKLSGKRLGLLINFNVVHLRDGIVRLVNRL